MADIGPVGEVFTKRGIGADQLPPAPRLPQILDEATEATRAKNVGEQFGAVAPGLVDYTTDYLFRDLWLARTWRSAIAASSWLQRSSASGQTAQVTFT